MCRVAPASSASTSVGSKRVCVLIAVSRADLEAITEAIRHGQPVREEGEVEFASLESAYDFDVVFGLEEAAEPRLRMAP